MWNVNGNAITMVEGDYGIKLPITISGATFAAGDSVKVIIKAHNNGTAVIEKEYSSITDNTVNLELTAAETALLRKGSYVYSLDWFQDGNFLCNIIPSAVFKVVDKA